MKLLLCFLSLTVLCLSGCGGGGGGGSSSTPPVTPTGEISGYITIAGTTASTAPVSSIVAQASISTSIQTSELNLQRQPEMSDGLHAEAVNAGGVEMVSSEDTEVLIIWSLGVSRADRLALLDRFELQTFGSNFGKLYSYRLKKGTVNPALQAELLKEKHVRNVSIIPLAHSQFVPTEAGSGGSYDFQWDMKQMGLERAWDVTQGSSSVRVAVIDSGFFMTSAEFTGRFVDGYDFVTDVTIANDGDGRDADPTDQPLSTLAGALNSHGTHVAATIGANANNGGMVGVDHGCKIIPIRALGIGGGSITDVLDALVYAADLVDADVVGYPILSLAPLDPTRPRPLGGAAHVINMSLANILPEGFYRSMYLELLSAVRAKGCIVVAAAGNSSRAIDDGVTLFLPAGSPDVISVGATTPQLTQASYSNYGSKLFLMSCGGSTAPDASTHISYPQSGGILSLDIDNILEWSQGTSMAAPHVAGVISLMLSVNPSLTPDEVDTILMSSCYDLGASGYDTTFGHGFLMADRAVDAAASIAPSPQLVSFAETLSISTDVTTVDWSVVNAGGVWGDVGTLSYTDAYITGSNWITAVTTTPQGTDGNLIGITVDRTGLADGVYEADLTLISTLGGSVVIRVSLDVQAVVPSPAFTEVFVLLMDASTDTLVEQVVVTLPAQNFTFSNIPAGSYYLVAGTDENNDGFVDDIGEYFGLYNPSIESIIFTFDPATDQSGLEIPLYLEADLSGAS